MDLPVDLLRTFARVCELKSFTRTGAALQRSQPAISLQMKRLEGLVGASLFRRAAAGVELTATGVTLLGYTRSILELSDEMMDRFRRREVSTIRLGLPNDYAATFLPSVLERFHAERHDVDLEVDCGISIELIDMLHRGKFDIVLAMTDGSGEDGASKSWPERLVWVSRPDVDPDHGERLPLIAYPHGCVYRQRMLGTLGRADKRAHVAYTTASLEGIVAGVHAGLGITAMSEHTVPAGLVVHRGDDMLPDLLPSRIGLFRNQAAMTGPAVRLMDCLAEAMEAVRPRAEAAA